MNVIRKVIAFTSLSALMVLGGVFRCSGIETNIINFAKEREKALNGDSEAQIMMAGYCYFQTNYSEMLNWYRKADAQGNAKGALNLGCCYAEGRGVAKDINKAIKWFRKAAEEGTAEIQYWVAHSILNEYSGVGRDPADTVLNTEGLKWLRKSAERGHAAAQRMMGDFHRNGEHLAKDGHEAFKWYSKAAEQGDSLGEGMLELLLIENWQDSAEIAHWLLKDKPRSRTSQFRLGSLYEIGKGVPTDEAKALAWYRKAAEQGHVMAQSATGRFYEKGNGTAKNPAEAAKWYRSAADQGDNSSQMALANLYAQGVGVPLDGLKAIEWYQKAAEKGFNDLALVGIAEIWAFGKGVPKNAAQAVRWYEMALASGNLSNRSKEVAATSECNLGIFYLNGDGVPLDYIEAYKWFNLAAAKGHSKALDLRNSVTSRMTPQQIAEAQRRASEFLAKKQSRNQRIEGKPSTPATPSDATPKASGSGFFITDDGYLITNAHVVDQASRIVLKTKLGAFSAMLVKLDSVNDIAVLKVAGSGFSSLPLMTSRAAKLGESVFTIGFPNPGLQGVEPKLTDGKISSLSGAHDDGRHFQISVAVQPGNSGGGLINSVGNVVGVVTARLSDKAALDSSGALPQNVNYALKSSYVLSLLESVSDVTAKLKEPWPLKERKFEDLVREAQEATALILIY